MGMPIPGALLNKEAELPFASATVIKNYIDHLTIWPVRAYVGPEIYCDSDILTYISEKPAARRHCSTPASS